MCQRMTTRLSFDDFLKTGPGERLLQWESAVIGEAVTDVFGTAALQAGEAVPALEQNRIQNKWRIIPEACLSTKLDLGGASPIAAALEALPFEAESFDLVVLTHALESSSSPQQVLREAVRVLEPEGRLVIAGFNPLGLWWQRQRCVSLGAKPYLPTASVPISVSRLKDWLSLLGLTVESGRFGVYSPALQSPARLRKWQWLDKAGSRWAPQLSNLFVLTAVKHTPGAARIQFAAARKAAAKLPRATLPAASSSLPNHFSQDHS